MKLMFYINTLNFGGAERVISVLANSFFSHKYDIVFVTTYECEQEYPLNKGIRRLNLENKNDKQLSKIKKNYNRISKLRKYIKQEKPDYLISFMAEANFRAIISSFLLKTKVIVSVRNDPKKEYPGFLMYLAQVFFMFTYGVVFQTQDAMNSFNSVIKDKSKIIYNPVSDDFFKFERKGIKKNIVSVGRLTTQKNHAMLINAFSNISNDFPEEKLLIYGVGPLEKELTQLINEKKMQEKIFLKGKSNHIASILNDSKLFVLSSDYEGMPNALIEAITVGMPVISTDCPCGGSRMLIENYKNGILTEVGNQNDLEKAMRTILNDEEIQNAMSNLNLLKRNEFTIEKIFAEWQQFLFRSN